MDFRIYVDITPETKFNWKVQVPTPKPFNPKP